MIEVAPLPETIGPHVWNWSGFKSDLNYKGEDDGVVVIWDEGKYTPPT